MLVNFDEWKGIEEQHKEKFGVKPNVISMFWSSPERIYEGKPRDEYQMLSKKDQEDYDKGNLQF